jgi:hypothetical protein
MSSNTVQGLELTFVNVFDPPLFLLNSPFKGIHWNYHCTFPKLLLVFTNYCK